MKTITTKLVWHPASDPPPYGEIVIAGNRHVTKAMEFIRYGDGSTGWRYPGSMYPEFPDWWCEFPEAPKKDPK